MTDSSGDRDRECVQCQAEAGAPCVERLPGGVALVMTGHHLLRHIGPADTTFGARVPWSPGEVPDSPTAAPAVSEESDSYTSQDDWLMDCWEYRPLTTPMVGD